MKNLIGVGIHKHPKSPDYPYYARICVNGKQIWLGYFKCEVKAVEAYNTYIDEHKLNKKKNPYVSCDVCDECVWEDVDMYEWK
jgi:hypothetical protein